LLAGSVEDLREASSTGKTALVMNFQGSDSLAGNPDMVEIYYRLGIRWMLLAYNVRTFAGRVGAVHVGLGLDWIYCQDMFREILDTNRTAYPTDEKGGYETAADFFGPEQIPGITEALLRRGYSEQDIRGILGENWIRVAGQVWK
jgi:microsomal dipeptidase-like Zn-dependent dipeptidase